MHSQAQWNEEYYGAPPILVPGAFVVPASNIRPMKVHFYCKVNFTINSNTCSELLATPTKMPYSRLF